MSPRESETSFESPNRYHEIETYIHISNKSQYAMRDLYNGRKKLANYKTDILRLVEHMQDKERNILWIVRCIVVLVRLMMFLAPTQI